MIPVVVCQGERDCVSCRGGLVELLRQSLDIALNGLQLVAELFGVLRVHG